MAQKVSVIIPVYNGQKTIGETLNSIISQSYKNLEIIVVDDGSIDNSAEIVKSIKDKRIKYYKIKNSGAPARPRNFGIKKSQGEFVAFCDQDDLWAEKKIARQLFYYQKNSQKKEIGIICTEAVIIDDRGKKINKNTPHFSGFLPSIETRESLFYSNFITACSAVVPKNILEEFYPLDESLKGNDDFDLWLRITKRYGVLNILEPLSFHRKSSNSLSADLSKIYIENEKIFEKLEKNENSVKTRIARGRNLSRIVTSKLILGDVDGIKEWNKKLKNYPKSKKMKIVSGLASISPALSSELIKLLARLNIFKP